MVLVDIAVGRTVVVVGNSDDDDDVDNVAHMVGMAVACKLVV